MKKVITYGTFDLLHNGHINLLKRAKELGDYLIVGVTSDSYDRERGKLNVRNDLVKRIEDVRSTGYADKIIIEEYFGQKIEDIQKYNVDVFAIGSDWLGRFDYLGDYCSVVYLERTKGVSSTQLRNDRYQIINVGIIGSDGEVMDLTEESKYVSGIEISGVLHPDSITGKDVLEEFLKNIDAVYLERTTRPMPEYIRIMLSRRKHVLFGGAGGSDPDALSSLYREAERNGLVLLEAVNTVYYPAFRHLISQIKSRKIGEIRDISLTFPEFSSAALLPIIKFLGDKYRSIDSCTAPGLVRGFLQYENASATFLAGNGAKFEGSMIISGTTGYACIPKPWWETEVFELRYDDDRKTEKYFYKKLGSGYRYVIQEFVRLIQSATPVSNKLTPQESVAAYAVMEKLLREKGD